jgi:ADP-ribosyl-[dinitrogen reductase] hydrolase
MEQVRDRARGVILGLAVGNLLGLPLEGRTRQQIRELYPKGVTEISAGEMARPMDDDLAQAVELAEALLESGNLTERFAARLVHWRKVNGRGMGRLTRQSIAQLEDKVPPPTAAYAVYRAKGGIASNGGIMRCPPVAVARWREPQLLARDTADTCAVTHYAPACQWSCVIINSVVSVLLAGGPLDLGKLLAAASADGCPDLVSMAQKAGVSTTILTNAIRNRQAPRDTNWMQGKRGTNGHTLLTMQAGLWAATTPLKRLV